MYGKTPAAPNEQLNQDIQLLCGEYARYNGFDEELCNKFGVKRGLRNADGTGVVAGITQVCNVHGYLLSEGEKLPIDGELTYRGYSITDLDRGRAGRKPLQLRGDRLAAAARLPAHRRAAQPFFGDPRGQPRAARKLHRGHDHEGREPQHHEHARALGARALHLRPPAGRLLDRKRHAPVDRADRADAVDHGGGLPGEEAGVRRPLDVFA